MARGPSSLALKAALAAEESPSVGDVETSSKAAPQDGSFVRSQVRYSLPPASPEEELFIRVPTTPGGEWPTNLVKVDVAVDFHDARPLAGKSSIDREGFEIHTQDSKVADWDDEAAVTSVFYQEAVDLVKRATGAKHVHVFDHTFRRANNSKAEGRPLARDPVEGVHVDYSAASAEKRLSDFFGEGVLRKGGRFGIVNLWRPLVDTVYDFPLGFIDATSLRPQDFSVYNLVYPDRVGQNQTLHPNGDKHRWYYIPRQRSNEVYLFKQYDSDGAKTQWVPHSAFKDPSAPPPGSFQPRESIELRIFVFYESEEGDIKGLQGQ